MAKTLNEKLLDVGTELRKLTKKFDALMEAIGLLEEAEPKAAKKNLKKKPAAKKAIVKKAKAKKTAAKKATAPKKAAHKKVATKKTVTKKTAKSAIETVFMYINRTKKGLDTEALIKKTGFDRKKVSNLIYKLKKQKRIVVAERGKYMKA